MKKFDWNKPMSRKDYAVLGIWSFIITIVMYAICMINLYKDEIQNWKREKIELIKTKLS